jgi:hypothetical protein
MTLTVPDFELAGGYEQYRSVRRCILETYALAFLQKHPKLKQVVGIATEPPSRDGTAGSSEDLIVASITEWTPDSLEQLEERKRLFEIVQPGNYTEYAIEGNEYPEVSISPNVNLPSANRRQRRAKAAEERRKNRKQK